jgi:hypothetical protein
MVEAAHVVTVRPRPVVAIANGWLWMFLAASVAYWIGRNVAL